MTTTSAVETALCSVDDCGEPARYVWPDLCLTHFRERRRTDRVGNRTRSRYIVEYHTRRDRVVEMSRQGFDVPRIAAELAITVRSVQRIRRQTGISVTEFSRFSPAEVATIEAMLDDGCSYAEIARTLGRDVGWIRRRWPGRGWMPEQGCVYRNWLQILETLA